jgi:hypothetical protein
VTLWPTRTYRWAYPILFGALAVGALWVALQALIHGTPADSVPWWFALIFAVLVVGAASLRNRAVSIRVNAYGRVAFLLTDGSTVQSIPGSMWGRAGLQSLADYLGIPFEGAQLIRSYWDFGRWS